MPFSSAFVELLYVISEGVFAIEEIHTHAVHHDERHTRAIDLLLLVRRSVLDP